MEYDVNVNPRIKNVFFSEACGCYKEHLSYCKYYGEGGCFNPHRLKLQVPDGTQVEQV